MALTSDKTSHISSIEARNNASLAASTAKGDQADILVEGTPRQTDEPRTKEELPFVDHSNPPLSGLLHKTNVMKVHEDQYKTAYAFYQLVEMDNRSAQSIMRMEWIHDGKPEEHLPDRLPLDSPRFLPITVVEDIIATAFPGKFFSVRRCRIGGEEDTVEDRRFRHWTALWRVDVETQRGLWSGKIHALYDQWRNECGRTSRKVWPPLKIVETESA